MTQIASGTKTVLKLFCNCNIIKKGTESLYALRRIQFFSWLRGFALVGWIGKRVSLTWPMSI